MKISNITQSLSQLNSSGTELPSPAQETPQVISSKKHPSVWPDSGPGVLQKTKSRTDDEMCAANALAGINLGISGGSTSLDTKTEDQSGSTINKISNGPTFESNSDTTESNESSATKSVKSEENEREEKNEQTNGWC